MNILLSGGRVFLDGVFEDADILIKDGVIDEIKKDIQQSSSDIMINAENLYIVPGFVDVHVHLREPGFSYKETIKSGTEAAAKGGYCAVCLMPNLNPAPDSVENLLKETELIEKYAIVRAYPYGTITKMRKGDGELSDFDELSGSVIAFSDDGTGVQNDNVMRKAMQKAKSLNKIIAAHCEDNSLLFGGYIHDGEYARKNGHKGISSESEWKQVKRDIALAKETGVKYHVCHISTKESVELIRQAKDEGVDITCETAPHYLVFCDEDLKDSGAFKMNPPIRSKGDRDALLRGICDGTIDMIATDHAPHSKEEKSKGLKNSAMGIVGLETAFSVLYTELVVKKVITLEKLISLMSVRPAERFEIENKIEKGKKANLALLDLASQYVINSCHFLSMGKSTPFDGRKVVGENMLTFSDGKIVWRKNHGNKRNI